MVFRTLPDIHNSLFFSRHCVPTLLAVNIPFYARINVLFVSKSDNFPLFWLKNKEKFVYMQFLSYICGLNLRKCAHTRTKHIANSAIRHECAYVGTIEAECSDYLLVKGLDGDDG